MSLSLTRAGRPSVAAVAALTAGALAAAALVVAAPHADAATQKVTSASATWGFKQSFRSYMASSGSVTVSQGAAFTGATSSPYRWPAAADAGGYDPITRAGTIHLAGKVTYAYPVHEMREISLANPTIQLTGNGTGVLKADVVRDVGGDTMPLDQGSASQVSVATLSGVPSPTVAATAGGQTATFANVVTTLTQSGVDGLGLGAFYSAGTTIDPLTFSVAYPAQPKVTTKVKASLVKKTVKVGKKGKLKVKVTASGLTPTGKVLVKERKKVLKRATLSHGKKTVTLPKLKKGKHKLVVRYLGNSVAKASSSSKVTLTVKK